MPVCSHAHRRPKLKLRVWNVPYIYFLTDESVSRYKRPFSVETLYERSANPKYHYSVPFFYKINKGDLPLMDSCVFWCDFIYVAVFFGCYCVTLVTPFVSRRKAKKPTK